MSPYPNWSAIAFGLTPGRCGGVPKKSLTDRFVASARSTTRENYFDSKISGLVLRVTPTGVKTWNFVYRSAGKPQWLTLGSYPAVCSRRRVRWQSITVTVLRLRVVIRRHSGGPNGRPPSSRRPRLRHLHFR